jgi:hypothetical protein
MSNGNGPTIGPAGPRPTPHPRRGPALAGNDATTDRNWIQNVGEHLNIKIDGVSKVLVHGNSETYIRGTKLSTTVGNLNEVFLSSKTELVGGTEVKLDLAIFYVGFVGLKNELELAAEFKYDHGLNQELAPSHQRKTGKRTEKATEREEFLGQLKKECADSSISSAKGRRVIAQMTRQYTKAKKDLKAAKDTIGAYSGEFGDVVWDQGNSTEQCSGKYKINAGGEFEVEAGGAHSIKGSKVWVKKKGGADIHCAGGKVKINKNLVVS